MGGGDSGIRWVEWVMAWKVVHDLSARGRRQWQQQLVRSLGAIRTLAEPNPRAADSTQRLDATRRR